MTTEPTRAPRVTIGVAVYNGERYLGDTLTSLLAQTYEDFELIVSDNASTDATWDIIRRFEKLDPRVRTYRFRANRGPAANYNKSVEMGRGEYFMWSAADDLRAPTLLERCVEVLDSDPGAVLAYTGTRIIDGDEQPVRDWDYEPRTDAPTAHERIKSLLFVDHKRHGAFEIFGLIRSGALDEAMPLGAFARADSVMLTRLALRGRFHRVPEPLFLNRDHPTRSVRSTPNRTHHGRGFVASLIGTGPIPGDEWWDPRKRGHIVWPEWKVLREYERAIAAAPLDEAERRACYRVLAEFAAKHTPKLTRDVLLNTEMAVRRLLEPLTAA